MTVRKNFNFDETVAKHLEEIAQAEGKTQTQIAQEAIEERYRQIANRKKLEIFDEIEDAFHGLLSDVDAKSVRIEHAVEKYGK